jgi:hypothetical protein
MGCLFVLVLAAVTAAMTYLFGYALWTLIVLGSFWLAALIASAIFGHTGFGGRGNTDLMIVIAGMFITAAIMIPGYGAKTPCTLKVPPCNEARSSLAKLADAENDFLASHKTFTADLDILNLKRNPPVRITVLKADEMSFVAISSHMACRDEGGKPKVFTWDSAKGGLQ